jgi:hypothetical protein
MNGSNGNPTAVQGSQVGVVLPYQDPMQLVQKGGVTQYGKTEWGENYNLLNALIEGADEVDFMKWAENDMKIQMLQVDEMKLKAQIEIDRVQEEEKQQRKVDAALRKADAAQLKIDREAETARTEEYRQRMIRIEWEQLTLGAGRDGSIHDARLAQVAADLEIGELIEQAPIPSSINRDPETGATYSTLADRDLLLEMDVGLDDRGIGGLIHDD